MSRLLFLAVVVVVVYLLLRSYRRHLPREDDPAKAEDMVRCAQCGVHLPKNECIQADGLCYCSEAHRLMHADQSK
ncbi:MAG: PP0621 family protein [Pseudomonadota bacterium]